MILHRDTHDSICCIGLRGQKHHHKWLCKIVLMILHLELKLYFVNTFYAMQIMNVRRRVVVVSYTNIFFSQSYIDFYATGQVYLLCFLTMYHLLWSFLELHSTLALLV